MLIAESQLHDSPVMGLQTGEELAKIHNPVIDPATLRIAGYELKGSLLSVQPSVLRTEDIREISDIGIIVDSSDEFVSPDDIIKLSSIYSLHFTLLNMSVIDEKKHKLGKVTDYTLDLTSFLVQQLVVRRPLFRSLNDTELIIHRSQIIEINNKAIIVHSEAKVPDETYKKIRGAYVNPFRKTDTANQPIER